VAGRVTRVHPSTHLVASGVVVVVVVGGGRVDYGSQPETKPLGLGIGQRIAGGYSTRIGGM
jgi:hypothetical protein